MTPNTKIKNWKNSFSNLLKKENSHLSTILKDIFIVSTSVWATFTYLEYLNPGLITAQIHSALLIFLHYLPIISFIGIILFVTFFDKKSIYQRIKKLSKENPLRFKKITLYIFVILTILTILLENSNNITINWAIIFTLYAVIITLGIFLIKKYILKNNQKKFTLSDKQIIIALFTIIILGGILRIYKLDFMSPAGDEYRHLLATKRYLSEGYFDYNTSLLTTYLLIVIKKIFNTDSLFILRLPFALMGTITIYFFYLIGKNIFNKKVGLVSAYLIAFMPLSVGLSQYIRGYSIELLVISIALYLFHTRVIKNIFFRSALSISFLYFVNSINNEARLEGFFKIFLVYIGVSICLNIFDKLKQPLKNKIYFLSATFSIGLCAIITQTAYKVIHLPEIHYLSIFNFFHSATTWFTIITPSILIFIIFLIPLTKKNKNSVLSLFFISFFVIFYFLFFFKASRTYQARYIFNFLPFLILLLSIGFLFLFEKLNIKKNILTMFLTLLIIFPPFQVIYNSINKKNGNFDKNSELPFFNNNELYKFLEKNKIKAEEIIVTAPWFFDYYFNQPFLKEEEKSIYVNFSKKQSFELKDRTKIFSIEGIRSEESLTILKKIIGEHSEIKYVFAHIPLNDIRYNFQSSFIPSKLPNLKLIDTIDKDTNFGFYIYLVNR